MRLHPAWSTCLNNAKNRGNALPWWRHLFLTERSSEGWFPQSLSLQAPHSKEQRMVRTPKESDSLQVGRVSNLSPSVTRPLFSHCEVLDPGFISVASMHHRANYINSIFYILDTLALGAFRPGRDCPFQGWPILRDRKGLSQDNTLQMQAANLESIPQSLASPLSNS